MRCLYAVLAAALACSGSAPAEEPDAAPDAAAADPGALRVGGQYATAVSLKQSSCDGVTVRDMPTSVSHTAGATTLTLTHAGNTYSGAVARDGTFATSPRGVAGGGELHTLTITGKFSTTGFTATVNADVSRGGIPACSYVVEWLGTRASGENVIPG